MNLHILLDSKNQQYIKSGDIVLLTSYSHFSMSTNVEKYYIDYSRVDINKDIYNVVNVFFNKQKGDWPIIRNDIYVKFIRPIYAVLDTLEQILASNKVGSIYMYGGSNFTFLKSCGAEGEGERTFYKTNWLVNKSIFDYLSGKYNIIWKAKKPSLFFSTYSYFNNRTYFLLTFLSILKHSLIDRKKRETTVINSNYISIVELPLQARHLQSLFDSLSINSYMICSMNPDLISEQKTVYIPHLSIRSLLSIFFRCKSIKIKSFYEGIPFIQSAFRREVKYLYYLYLNRERRLLSFFSHCSFSSNPLLITNVTVGLDMVSCHSLSKAMGWNHYNFQYVTMSRILYPNLDLADKYFLYSGKSYDLYKDLASCYCLYLPMKVNTRIVQDSSNLVLSIFMQPDSFVYDYLKLFSELFPLLKQESKPVKVIIKPHYRQNKINDIIKIAELYDFVHIVGLHDSCEEILNESHLALSINSSVIFEALTNQIMCLVYNPNNKYNDSIYNNDICFPDVNFVVSSPYEIIGYINNYNKYNIEYHKRLKESMTIKYCNLRDIF